MSTVQQELWLSLLRVLVDRPQLARVMDDVRGIIGRYYGWSSLELVFSVLNDMQKEWLINIEPQMGSAWDLVDIFDIHTEDVNISIQMRGREAIQSGLIRGSKVRQRKKPRGSGVNTIAFATLIEQKQLNYRKPKNLDEAIEKIASSIASRRGQKAFRDNLLYYYGETCLITGPILPDMLEAAHIQPYSEGGAFELSNGLLLRPDIHTLFDLGLIGIKPEDLTIIISKSLEKTDYKYLQGKPSRIPRDLQHKIDRNALRNHKDKARL